MGTLIALSRHPRYRRRRLTKRLADCLADRLTNRLTGHLTDRVTGRPADRVTRRPADRLTRHMHRHREPGECCPGLARAAGDFEAAPGVGRPRLRLVPPVPTGPPRRGMRMRVLGVALVAAMVTATGVVLADRPAAGAPAYQAPATGYQWPLPGSPQVVRPFDPPPEPWDAGHRGVDLSGTGGEPVLAAGSGTVAFAGQVAGVGVVSIDHAGGLRTTYQPLVPSVRVGQHVVAGQRIGTLQPGHPGCTVAACLHWGLKRGDEYLDPLILLGLGEVRLLPVRQSR
jgi:peptidase M23-like protein